MKTKRIIALLLVAVLSLGILASCGGSETTSSVKELVPLSISDVYKSGIDWDAVSERDAVFTQVSDYEFLGSKNIIRSPSNYVIYENTNVDPIKYVIYNLYLEKEICSVEKDKIEDVHESIECTPYYVSIVTTDENGNETTTVYSNKGDVLYTTDGYYSIDIDEYEYTPFLQIGNKLYKINYKDSTLTEAATLPAIWDDGEHLIEIDDAFVSINGNSVVYYNKTTLDIIASYVLPFYYDDYRISLLENGNAFIQTETELDDSAVEFDVYGLYDEQQVKYDIDCFIFNYSDKSIKEIEFDSYVIVPQVLMNKYYEYESEISFHDIFNEDIKNISYAIKVENHRVDPSHYYVVSLSNDGEIEGYINSQVDYQQNILQNWGNYFITSNNFATYILDRSGNVVKQIHSTSVDFCDFGIYDYAEHKIYNEKLELVKDFSDCSIHAVENSYILYSTEDSEGNESFYFYTKAGDKKVAIPAGFEHYGDYSNMYTELVSDSLFCFTVYSYNEETYESTYKYRYYNNEGTFLFESDYSYSYYKTFDGFAIIRAYNYGAGNYVYKKVVAAKTTAAQ